MSSVTSTLGRLCRKITPFDLLLSQMVSANSLGQNLQRLRIFLLNLLPCSWRAGPTRSAFAAELGIERNVWVGVEMMI